MGSCLSTQAPPPTTPAAGGLPVGPTSLLSSALTSGSKRWMERRKKKERRGEAAGGGGGEDSELYRVPGRMFVNGSSEVACLFTQQGKKGTNQDAMIVWENFTSRSDTIFCGVFDGHGPFGHMVAKKVRDALPLKLHTEWKTNASGQNSPHQNGSASGSMNSEESAYVNIDDVWAEPLDVDENIKLPDVYPALKQSLLKAFKLMDKELKLHPTIDCFCSGTTAVTVIKQVHFVAVCPLETKVDLAELQGQDLVIGNVGDSRAILGTRDKDNNLSAVQLTVDLKPNLPREAARIQQCKGRVFALQDEPEVARVWLPNSDSPGLAMARAFGDFCLKDYGLISVPDISYRLLTEKDEFIVLATDGVWDVLSNKEVVDIIASAPTHATAARALVECAVRVWRLKFPTSKIDDCAVVCLFLDPPPSSAYPPQESDANKTPQEQHVEVVSVSIDKEETNNMERDERVPEGPHSYTAYLEQSNILHDADDEIVPVSEEPVTEKLPGRSNSTRSLADCMSATEEEEWSALEGVTRVNSLVNLPRFSSTDKSPTSRKKWL